MTVCALFVTTKNNTTPRIEGLAPVFGTFTKEAAIADSIADAFRSGDVEAELNGHGISTMRVEWRGHRVFVSWYGSGRPRDIRIDGDGFFPEGRASKRIFEAAWTRANGLLSEKLNNL